MAYFKNEARKIFLKAESLKKAEEDLKLVGIDVKLVSSNEKEFLEKTKRDNSLVERIEKAKTSATEKLIKLGFEEDEVSLLLKTL